MFFRNYIPSKKGRALPLEKKKLEFSLFKNALCKVWLILPKWSWRRRFLNFVNIFLRFRNCLPLEKGRALYLDKLEFPPSKGALSRVWLKLVQLFWRRRFYNFINVFSLFRQVFSPRKRAGPII